MSINVTVHGNPISIKRGKMVALDADKEFEFRRRIRLQQVRQQSKEIAEEVRNKVRKEKDKQFSKLEKKAEKDLRKQKERKLETLKKQYQDCLKEFGSAYKSAEAQPDPNEILELVSDYNRCQAELRGKTAAEKLKEEKKLQENESKKHIECKKQARVIENVRSKLVTSIPKNKTPFKAKRRKKCVADITINGVTHVISDDSDNTAGSDIEHLSVLDEISSDDNRESLIGMIDSSGNLIDTDIMEDPTRDSEVIIVQDQACDTRGEVCSDAVQTENFMSQQTQTSETENRYNMFPICGVDEDCRDDKTYRSHSNLLLSQRLKNRLKLLSELEQKKDELLERSAEPVPLNYNREYRKKYDDTHYDASRQTPPCVNVLREINEYSKENSKKSSISERIKQRMKDYDSSDTKRCACSENRSDCTICNYPKSVHVSEYPKRSKKLKQKHMSVCNKSTSPERYKYSDENLKYKDRLQSGSDVMACNKCSAYHKRECFCEEANHYKIKSIPSSPSHDKRSSKNGKKNSIKAVKSRHNLTSKPTHVFRKTIRSSKVPVKSSGHSNATRESEGINDYTVPPSSIKRISPVRTSRSTSPNKSKASYLPFVPTTVVKPEVTDSQDSTIRYYDHFHRFGKDGLHPTVVQKISKESIAVCPPSDDERQYRDIMHQRDQEARKRGNKALEKNKIRRDYQQLLEELPVLQRQERLASMANHRPSVHMSNERYQELQRKKQNIMENKFENYQAKSKSFDIPLITLKSIRKSPPCSSMIQPFKTLDISENSPPVLNVGQWENIEVEQTPQSSTSQEEITTDSKTEDNEETLANLLKRINKQREILLKEAANLPSLSTLKNILNEEDMLSIVCNCSQKKIFVEKGTSPLVTKESGTSKRAKKSKSVTSKSSIKRTATSSSDTSVETPQHKTKKGKIYKKLKVIFKEESTQTSHSGTKIAQTCTEVVSEQMKEEGTQTVPPCSPRDCSLQTQLPEKDSHSHETILDTVDKDTGKVCEIIIRTGDDKSNVKINKHHTLHAKQKSPRLKGFEGISRKDAIKKSGVRAKVKGSTEKGEVAQKGYLEISTSTSYMSPPIDVGKRGELAKPSTSKPAQRASNKDLLQPQKQQTNFDQLVTVENGSKEVNPRLVRYIQRLLSMSRQSIDELTISSVSDVSTPQESVIQTASNLAREKLQSVMDHFNLSADDVKKFYISSSSFSTSDVTIEDINEQLKTAFAGHNDVYSSDDKKINDQADSGRHVGRTHTIHREYISVSTSTEPEETLISPKTRERSSSSKRTVENIYTNNYQEPYVSTSTSYHHQSRSKSPRTTTSKQTTKLTSTEKETSTSSERIHPVKPCLKNQPSASGIGKENEHTHEVHVRSPTKFVKDTAEQHKIVRIDEHSSVAERKNVRGRSPMKSELSSPSKKGPEISKASPRCVSPKLDSRPVSPNTSVVKCKSPRCVSPKHTSPVVQNPVSPKPSSPKHYSSKPSSPKIILPKCVLPKPPPCRSVSPKPVSLKPAEIKPTSPKSALKSPVSKPVTSRDSSPESCRRKILVPKKTDSSSNSEKQSYHYNNMALQESRDISASAEFPSYEEAVWRQPEKFLQFVRQSLGMTVEEFAELGFQEMFSRHMELTEYCHDRIKSLMDLIEKVRNEKRSIYSPSSPVDQSMTLTSYLDLPQRKSVQIEYHSNNNQNSDCTIKSPNEDNTSGGSGSSVSQGTMDNYLLALDIDIQSNKENRKEQDTCEAEVLISKEGSTDLHNTQETFVPMLQGIPKYSEVDCTREAENLMATLYQQLKPKPPPSLLRANIRGHTDIIPHELSTIAEGDTILSSRNTSMHHPHSPERVASREVSPTRYVIRPECISERGESLQGDGSKNLEVKYVSPVHSDNCLAVTSDSGDYITISPERMLHYGKDPRKDIKYDKRISPSSNTSSSSVRDEVDESRPKSIMSGVRPLSDSTNDSPDDLESMLRKFKLEWAISLVKKTEQALAMSSSSSASDLIHPRVQQLDNSSDVSVKEPCKQLYKRLTSSNGSDIDRSHILSDISQHFREFHDVSEIPGVADSRNKSQQRTSTPVQHSKSTESKKSLTNESLFKVDSELSSVRNSSDDNLFLSIPNISLNTTNCSLNKIKK